MRAINIILLSLAGLFVLALQFLSLSVSYRFGASFGSSDMDALVMGGISAAIDGFKMMLPVIAGIAALYGMGRLSRFAWVFWLPLAMIAIMQTYGYIVTNREDTGVFRKMMAALGKRADTQIGRLEKDLKRSQALATAYAKYCVTARQKRRRKCRSRAGQLAALGQPSEIRARLDAARERQMKGGRARAKAGRDPQLVALNRLSGLSFFSIMSVIAFALGIFMEMVGGFGGLFVWGPLVAALGGGPEQKAADIASGVSPAPAMEAMEVAEKFEESAPAEVSALRRLGAAVGIGRIGEVAAFARTLRRGGGEVGGADLFERYRAWCSERGLVAVTFGEFHDQMAEQARALGLSVSDRGRGRRFGDRLVYGGLELAA